MLFLASFCKQYLESLLIMSEFMPVEAPDPARLVSALDYMHVERCFSTEGDRLTFIHNLSLESFHTIRIWVNGVLRGLPADHHGYADADYLTTVTYEDTGGLYYMSPLGEDRAELIDRAFDATRRMHDLEKIGTMLGLVGLAVHDFEDANGRLARFTLEMLRTGYRGRKDADYYVRLLKNVQGRGVVNLATNRADLKYKFSSWSVRSSLQRAGINDIIPFTVTPFSRSELNITGRPPTDIKRDIADIAEEPILNKAVLTEFIIRSGRDLHDYAIEGVEGRQYIDGAKIIRDIVLDEARLLWKVYGEVKRAYVTKLIDCFADDDQSVYGPADDIVRIYRPIEGARVTLLQKPVIPTVGDRSSGGADPLEPSKLIVDIGAGEYPFPLGAGNRILGANEMYRGFDLFERGDSGLVNILLQNVRGRHSGRRSVERADARALPVESGSADEVLLTNVLSDPRVTDMVAIIAEISRILRRPEGTVTVVDTYAPEAMPLELLRRILGGIGLKQLNEGQEGDKTAIAQYARPNRSGGQYIGVFGFRNEGVNYTRPEGLSDQLSVNIIQSKEVNSTMPGSGQHRYHGEVGQVIAAAEQLQVADAHGDVEARAALGHMALVATKLDELIQAIEAAERHCDTKLLPAQRQVAARTVEIRDALSAAVSVTGNHPNMAAAARLLTGAEDMVTRSDGGLNSLVGGYQQNLDKAASVVAQLGPDRNAIVPSTDSVVSVLPPAYTDHAGVAGQMITELNMYVANT